MLTFSHWLESSTQPQAFYYHSFQLGLISTLSFIGTAMLTSIPLNNSAIFALVAYGVNQLITPFFQNLFHSFHYSKLIPQKLVVGIGQVILLTSTLLIAKEICHLAGIIFSFREIRIFCTVFTIAFFIMQLALTQFRKNLN